MTLGVRKWNCWWSIIIEVRQQIWNWKAGTVTLFNPKVLAKIIVFGCGGGAKPNGIGFAGVAGAFHTRPIVLDWVGALDVAEALFVVLMPEVAK